MQKLEKVQRPLAIYAHPDDEIIGCSFAIHQLRDRIHLVYATDGMPSPIDDPAYYVPHTRYEYSNTYRSMRMEEAQNALSLLGMKDSSRTHFFDLPDSHLHEHFGHLIDSISTIIRQIKPDLIITAAYEGGHIDHDILTAAIWRCTEGEDITICETPLYSLDSKGEIRHNWPVNRHRDWENHRVFSPGVSVLKKRAFEAYGSQQNDLQYFNPMATELYHFTEREVVSNGDFSIPPNDGNILYAQTGGIQFRDFQTTLASSTSSRVNL